MEQVVFDDNGFDPKTDFFQSLDKVKHLDLNLRYSKMLREIDIIVQNPYAALFMGCLDHESVEMLIKQARTLSCNFTQRNMFLAKFIFLLEDVDYFEETLVKEGFLDPSITANILDFHIYNGIVDALEKNHNVDMIKEERKKVLNSVFEKGIYSNEFFATIFSCTHYYCEGDYEEYSINAISFILDLLSDFFFEDYYTNVCIEINEMLNYENLSGKKIIPQERKNFYESFLKLKDDPSQIPAFIKKYINEGLKIIDIKEEENVLTRFYDDVRNSKNDSYEGLLSSCTTFDKKSPLYKPNLSERYGCDTYYLDGEPFFALVRTNKRISKYEIDPYGIPDLTKVLEQPNQELIDSFGWSYTFIGTDNIQTFKNPNIYATFVYTDVAVNNVIHLNKIDSYSSNYYYASNYVNELHTSKSILQETLKYPEMVVRNPDVNFIDGKPEDDIKPRKIGIICFDEPTKWDIEFAKRNNIALIIINSSKYPKKDEEIDYTQIKEYQR